MANLIGEDTFSDVYQLETTDPVLGGAGGIANAQAQALTNRTLYLYNTLLNVYTKSETDQIINNLIAAAPGALDTLNELAAALGDDPNFATTIVNLISTTASNAAADATSKANAAQAAAISDAKSKYNPNWDTSIPVTILGACNSVSSIFEFKRVGNLVFWRVRASITVPLTVTDAQIYFRINTLDYPNMPIPTSGGLSPNLLTANALAFMADNSSTHTYSYYGVSPNLFQFNLYGDFAADTGPFLAQGWYDEAYV